MPASPLRLTDALDRPVDRPSQVNSSDAIGAGLGLASTSVSADEATAAMGFIGAIFALHVPASSALTRDRFGWQPSQPTLLEDLAAVAHF